MTPLSAERLAWRCDSGLFDFKTTAEVVSLTEIVGQRRAADAVSFGVEMRQEGYNVYLLGPPGIGKRSLAHQFLGKLSQAAPVPPDWIYVNNFEHRRRPLAISIPAGRGRQVRNDVRTLTKDLAKAILSALESDEHRTRAQAIEREAIERQQQAIEEFGERAQGQDVQLIRTPGGFALAPLRNSQVLSPDEFEKLSPDERKRIEQKISVLQKELQEVIERFPRSIKETQDKLKQLHRDAVALAIGHLLEQMRSRYADLPQIVKYFDAVQNDILERVDEFQPGEESGSRPNERSSFTDYAVNLVVDHSETRGAPIVYEDHPSYHNLLGRVEHVSEMGALVTNFMLIKPGALHRANGGYLVLDVYRLLQQPFAWDGLKRALLGRCIRIESLGEALSLVSTVSLEPEPIPLNLKVLLLGDRFAYYVLYALDPDFAELFKVAADFEEDSTRSPESCRQFGQLVATVVRRENHRPVDRAGVARLAEHAARLADDSEKISLHLRSLADVLREANHWAGKSGADVIEARHVDQAIEMQIDRADRIRKRLIEDVLRGSLLIDTSGQSTAQINGLSVVDLGNFRFGHPVRITATARVGRGEVTDIEREVKLGGSLHSKGVMILSSFLAARYAGREPLSLSASLVFEQSYGPIEGDSASLAELCALMSAIAEIPIRQDLAVTGSVNQFGQIQPIGGVNEKIEGFFDICRARGLSSSQGVVIPASNVKHLMLRHEVVDAAAAGRFHVYAVETVDEAMELLTGRPAGVRDADGSYREDSVNGRVDARLREFAKLRAQFGVESQQASKFSSKHD